MNKLKVTIALFFNKIIRHTKWYKTIWGDALKIYNLNTFGLQVVNLGSGSGAHNFRYDGFGLKGFNFALSPQSLLHDYNILKNYFSYFAKGCTVLIPVCPFSGMIVEYDSKHTFKYYPILHPATIPNFNEEERTRAYRMLKNPFSEMPFYCMKRTIVELLYSAKKIITNKPSSINLQATAVDMMAGWKRQFSIDDLSAPISPRHQSDIDSRKKTLGDMLDFCLARGFKPVVVIPAMHSTLSQMIPSLFDNQYMSPLIGEAKKRGVTCLDYMRDARFNKSEYYQSALFMNETGAKVFTRQILKDLGLSK